MRLCRGRRAGILRRCGPANRSRRSGADGAYREGRPAAAAGPERTPIKQLREGQVTRMLMEDLYRQLMIQIGEDPNREGLRNTPRRAARAFEFLTRGYKEDIDAIVNNALFEADTKEMILVRNIEMYSMCEHHLLPFIGKCHVGYIPNRKVLGLSKVARIVDVYARRLQIQEKLTKEIGEAIQKYTNALGVAVVIEAQHLCMMMRGVEKQNSVMTTSYIIGEFHEDNATRAEFFSLINK